MTSSLRYRAYGFAAARPFGYRGYSYFAFTRAVEDSET
jgi:hypothetical protein